MAYYPASVHVDQIYRTRANRSYCKAKGIPLSCKPLGRPKKATAENQSELRASRKQCYQDEVARIPIEGKFGNSKRKGTLNRIMAKLSTTSESVIHVGLIVLNLQTWLRKTLICLYVKSLQRLESISGMLTDYFDERKYFDFGRFKPAGILFCIFCLR